MRRPRVLGLSRFESEQYTSAAFVESVGAVLFRLSSLEVCVLHDLKHNEYVLAKGRRNCGESPRSPETGFACRLLPLNMHTRAPPGFIWWYVAAVDKERAGKGNTRLEKDRYAVEFHSYTGALDKLTFQMGREMVKKVIELVENALTDALTDTE
ncbi:hypothetical protein C8A03DRAFT_43414 [Achaetomium macrosporum]|uniref:Uncharacterized protein n=1 Tax=Achaetomium macrosporum TaxID=79813 RepID=A0AAN7CB97_9PEZI|nr:hypothetical protein C8A03DRAFT_43414 [Achaetomium macrosporum]